MTTLALQINEKTYGQLLRRALPRIIHSNDEYERLTSELMELDERDSPSPEEKLLDRRMPGLQTPFHLVDGGSPHIDLKLELVLQWRLRGIHESQVLLHLLNQGFHSGQIIAERLILIVLVLIILA